MKHCCKHLPCIGSALIALLFIFSGVGKILDFNVPLGMIAGKGLPMAGVLAVAAIVIELSGALMILTRWKACIGSMMLIGYVVLATLLFHMGPGQMRFVLSNLALIGGLMLILSMSKTSHGCSDKKEKKSGCCDSKGHCGC